MHFQKNFYLISRLVGLAVIISAAIILVGRGIFFFQQADLSMINGREQDLMRAFWVGMRFDLKIATIGFAPLLLAGLLLSAFPRLFSVVRAIAPYYAGVIFFLVTAFTIGNYYYYITFGNYIDVFVFGLFDDDTEAVLTNAWQDYPIVVSFLTTLLVTGLAAWLIRSVARRISSREPVRVHWGWATLLVAGFVLAYVALARGSVSTLPLKRYHANVSDYDMLNKITPNAFMALDWARSDYKKQATFAPVDEQQVTAHMQKVLGQPTPEYQTPENRYLAENKPHVVMALMEGFGSNILVDDNAETNDLLGALRPAFEQDFVFRRFMAGTSATIDSMMMMLLHSNVPTISHSSAQKVQLPGSAVLPYKQAGYEVVYITAGNAMWRNLSNYLPRQGFDRIVDENTLLKAFPEAEDYYGTWGVPDEYAFKYADKLLRESDKPLMIYILTVTNHSPFKVPGHYTPKPVRVSERLQRLLGPMKEHGEALLGGYQYANDALGQFIAGIKAGPLAERTLIAASGDHRMRYLDTREPSEFGLTYGVPFYLYVPDTILASTEHHFDAQRIGSHRDIFPTLYHYSLSQADYVTLGGENLLTNSGVSNFGYNNARVMIAEGAFATGAPALLYPWQGDGMHSVPEPVANPQPTLAAEYHKLQDYYLRLQIMRAQQ
jgi:phosphoglycerol transferase MdoB-like AlkP superfamily enzyme